jgi:hypothetical protein
MEKLYEIRMVGEGDPKMTQMKGDPQMTQMGADEG